MENENNAGFLLIPASSYQSKDGLVYFERGQSWFCCKQNQEMDETQFANQNGILLFTRAHRRFSRLCSYSLGSRQRAGADQRSEDERPAAVGCQ